MPLDGITYGYRPGKSAIDAVAVTRRRCWRYNWLLEFDIKGLFDNIDHDLLMRAVKTHIGNWLENSHGFEFLGYRFEGGQRNVRSKSLKKLKENIRLKTRRTRGDSIEIIISDLNPTIKSCFAQAEKVARFW